MNDIIHQILDRLDTIEAAIGNDGPPLVDDDEQDRRLSTVMVAKRYGTSTRTISRWQEDPEVNFPKPDITINGRNYWWMSTLKRHERARVSVKSRLPAG